MIRLERFGNVSCVTDGGNKRITDRERGGKRKRGEGRETGCRASLSEGERIVGLLSRVSCQARNFRATVRGGGGWGEREGDRKKGKEEEGVNAGIQSMNEREKQHVGESKRECKKERAKANQRRRGEESSELETNVNDKTEGGKGTISHASACVILCVFVYVHEHDYTGTDIIKKKG